MPLECASDGLDFNIGSDIMTKNILNNKEYAKIYENKVLRINYRRTK